MKATTSIDTAKVITHPTTGDPDGEIGAPITGQAKPNQNEAREQGNGQPESELRAAARRKGLNLKELAARMGVNYSHMCAVANGKRPWTADLREKVKAVLGEVPGQGTVYRQGGLLQGKGQSTYIREKARERGLSLRQVADRTGLSYGYVVQAARGQRNLGPAAQARMEAVLEAPVKVEVAQPAEIDPQAFWERMDAHGWSQNEVARRAGISKAMFSQVMNGQRTPSGDVLSRLHEVLFAPSAAELVAPVELKVMGWKKDGRNGMVIRGGGGPGSGTIRTGGRVPWGAEVEFAYTAGYDSRGRVSVHHLVDERSYSMMLKQREPEGL